MEKAFWHERWNRDEIGFHLKEIHPFLTKGLDSIAPAKGPIFVPLCGKSRDMIHLANRGFSVIGVELSSKAIEDFFAEQGLSPEISLEGDFSCYRCDSYRIYCGDLFLLDPQVLKDVKLVYDRGSLVALPPQMRERYYEFLGRVLPEDISILLVNYGYDQTEMSGPPFHVAEEDIRKGFGSLWQMSLLESKEALEENPLLKQRGLSALEENAWWLRRSSV